MGEHRDLLYQHTTHILCELRRQVKSQKDDYRYHRSVRESILDLPGAQTKQVCQNGRTGLQGIKSGAQRAFVDFQYHRSHCQDI